MSTAKGQIGNLHEDIVTGSFFVISNFAAVPELLGKVGLVENKQKKTDYYCIFYNWKFWMT